MHSAMRPLVACFNRERLLSSHLTQLESDATSCLRPDITSAVFWKRAFPLRAAGLGSSGSRQGHRSTDRGRRKRLVYILPPVVLWSDLTDRVLIPGQTETAAARNAAENEPQQNRSEANEHTKDDRRGTWRLRVVR